MSSNTKLTEKFKNAASTNNGRIHVVPSKDGWSVKKEGVKRATVVSTTKEGALKAAHKINAASKVVVHKKDGTIQ